MLAGIAVFLILRLKNVLGTREGFEQPPVPKPVNDRLGRPDLEVIEGGPDLDITDHVDEDSDAAKALGRHETCLSHRLMSLISFRVPAGAYEMIVMGYETGDLAKIQPFLTEEIYESFVDGVAAREDQGLTIEADFIGVRELKLVDATFDETTREGELSIRFVAELTSTVRDQGGDIVEGSPTEVKRQKDTWSFARTMGADDPNWLLVSTDA